eukprot:2780597-Rhodomonas_salina.1
MGPKRCGLWLDLPDLPNVATLAPMAGCKPLPGPQQSYLLIKRSDSSAMNVSALEYAGQYASSRSLPMVVGGDHSLA